LPEADADIETETLFLSEVKVVISLEVCGWDMASTKGSPFSSASDIASVSDESQNKSQL